MIVFLVLVFAFRSLASGITTHLSDWNDYPFYVWTLYQNIGHFKSLTFHGFFNTNIYAPYQGSLLFSDLLLPQSLIALPLTLFTSNHILVFNIVFFISLLLDVVAVYFLWHQVTKDKFQLFFAVFATCISGFVFQNSVHFQILGFWPFFFGLGYLVRQPKRMIDAIWVGFWMGIQFLSGVYLSIFLLCAATGWYFVEMLWSIKKRKMLLELGRQYVSVLITFVCIAGFFIYKYIQIKHAYLITREYWEYVYYSAHVTDYLFSLHYNSVASKIWPISKWNNFDRAGSLFPGGLLVGLAICGLYVYRKSKDRIEITLHLVKSDVYFFLLLIFGFFASIGPRLNVNGSFIAIPLPYFLPLKFLPILEPIRVNGRWSIFVLIALVYFAVKGMKKFSFLSSKVALFFMCAVITLEVMPVARVTEAKAYYHDAYNLISPICVKSPKVLLEYPMTQDAKDVNVVSNLTYRTQQMLASLEHKCILVNGYMGYSPKDYDRYEQVLTDSVNRDIPNIFWRLISEKNIQFIKLNKKSLFSEKVTKITDMLTTNPKVKILENSDDFLLVEVQK